MSDVVCVDPAIAGCGEGPLWDVRRQRLWWVDIAGKTLHSFDPIAAVTTKQDMPFLVSALAVRSDGMLLIATANGIGVLNTDTGEIDILHDPEPEIAGNRLNDMVVGPDGRLWAGTMSEGARAATGALYLYGPDGVNKMKGNNTISNGLDASDDGERLYFIDSVPGILYVRESGQWRTLLSFDEAVGKPDGMALDSQGTLWVALCNRGRVVSISPEGKMLGEIELPCEIVTSCAFGGADLSTLYITTGTFSMSDEEKAKNPFAGGLFAYPMSIPGRAPFEAQWP